MGCLRLKIVRVGVLGLNITSRTNKNVTSGKILPPPPLSFFLDVATLKNDIERQSRWHHGASIPINIYISKNIERWCKRILHSLQTRSLRRKYTNVKMFPMSGFPLLLQRLSKGQLQVAQGFMQTYSQL